MKRLLNWVVGCFQNTAKVARTGAKNTKISLELETLEKREVPTTYGYRTYAPVYTPPPPRMVLPPAYHTPVIQIPLAPAKISYAPIYNTVPNTMNWSLGGVAGDTRALSGTSLANPGLSYMASNIHQQGSQATANSIFNFNQFQQNLLNSNPVTAKIGQLPATAATAQAIYMDPTINKLIQSNPTALFVVGSGFTPATLQGVYDKVNAMPNTRGSMIDLPGTAALAGLDGRMNPEGKSYNLVPMMQTITSPGPAFAQSPIAANLGIGPNWTPASSSSLNGILGLVGLGIPSLH